MKTTAEILVSSLDKFSGTIDDMYQKLQQVAPEVWKLAVTRYTTLAFANLFYCVLWVSAGIALFKFVAKPLFKRGKTSDERFNTTDEELQRAMAWLVAVISGAIVVGALSVDLPDAIDYFLNAKFYAAMCLVGRGCGLR